MRVITCRRCGDTAGKHRVPGRRELQWRPIAGWVRFRMFDLQGREKPGRRSLTFCPTCLRDLDHWLDQTRKTEQPQPEAGAARVDGAGG
jgi:hypothetical protein